MASLKDTVVSGSLRATDTIYSTTNQFQILRIPTTSGGATYGVGTNGQVLKSNGTSVYWASDNNTTALTSMTGTLGIDHGGTGATTAATAKQNLGLGNVAALDATIKTYNALTQHWGIGCIVQPTTQGTKTFLNKRTILILTDTGLSLYNESDNQWIWSLYASSTNIIYRLYQNPTESSPGTVKLYAKLAFKDNDTSAVGDNTTPIYLNSDGKAIAGTALKALAYKDKITGEDLDLQIGGRNLALNTSEPIVLAPNGTNDYCWPTNFYPTSEYGMTQLADTRNEYFTVSFDWSATDADATANCKASLKYTSTTFLNIGGSFQINTGESSGHFSRTFTPNDGARQYGTGWILSGLGSTSNRNIKITLSNFKFEIGSCETDWTPAPEDTLQQAQEKVDEIKIGGRNLILNSYSYAGWYIPVSSTNILDRSESGILRIAASEQTETMHYRSEGILSVNSTEVLDTNESYVISFEIYSPNWNDVSEPAAQKTGFAAIGSSIVTADTPRGNQKAYLYSYLNDSNFWYVPQLENNKWLRFVSKPIQFGTESCIVGENPFGWTGRLTYGIGQYLRFGVSLRSNGEIKLRRFKIEKGTRATDWTPAPEDQAPAINGIYYGECTTAQATQAKTVTLTNGTNFVLRTGAIVAIKFTNASAAATMTLNVNGTGAKNLYQYGTTAMSSSVATSGWQAGAVVIFVYDGTAWIRQYYYNSTYYYHAVYSVTAANTAAKIGTASNYDPASGKYFMFLNVYANTYAGAITLNITNSGAKPIYINGSPSSSTNYSLPSGYYLVYYDGTAYHFRTDDYMPGNITGTASNVRGTIDIAHGGTNATTTTGARTNLELGNAKIFYGVCNTAAGTTAKVVECSEFASSELKNGAAILVTFTNTNTGTPASLTMNVNGSGAKAIKKQYNTVGPVVLNGAGELYASNTYLFVYNSSQNAWILITADYNTDDTASVYSTTGASRTMETAANGGVGSHQYAIEMMTLNQTWSAISCVSGSTAGNQGTAVAKVAATANFLLNSPIIYTTNEVYTGPGKSSNINGYTARNVDLRYSIGTTAADVTLTYQKPVYLVGTVNTDKATFKLDATQWWTQTLPTSYDGKIYIFLGMAYNASSMYLHTSHPIYYHNGISVIPYTPGIISVDQGGTGATSGGIAHWNLQRSCFIAYYNSDYESYPWYKIAYTTLTQATADRNITFLVTNEYSSSQIGIIRCRVRTNANKNWLRGELKWLIRDESINCEDYVLRYTDATNTSCTVEIWAKQPEQYSKLIFTALNEAERASSSANSAYWTLKNNTVRGSASYTTGTGGFISNGGEYQPKVGIIYKTDAPTVRTDNTALRTGDIWLQPMS